MVTTVGSPLSSWYVTASPTTTSSLGRTTTSDPAGYARVVDPASTVYGVAPADARHHHGEQHHGEHGESEHPAEAVARMASGRRDRDAGGVVVVIRCCVRPGPG